MTASSSASENEQTCRAALFHGEGDPLEIQSIPRPAVQAHEALVKIECCTVCGSDLHTITGARKEAVPSILGHEILGVVETLGDPPPTDVQGQPLSPGDRVTWSVAVSCQQCDRCLSGLPQKCRHLTKYGHEVAEGRTALSGGLAEYILIRNGSAIVKVDPKLPAEVICPVNCATATITAAYRKAGELDHKRVLIFGAGMLGLSAAAFARWHKASQVVVCDLSPERLEIAKQFGADAAVVWQDDFDTLQEQLTAATGNELFDVILELSGSPAAVEAACRLGDINANIILIGTVMKSRPVSIDPEQVVRRWLSIHGVHNYAPVDLQSAVEFLAEAHTAFPFASLVENSFSLSNVNDAIEFAIRERPIRVAVRP